MREETYSPEEAKEAAKRALTEAQSPEEQLRALIELPSQDLRQVLIGTLLEDI